MGPGLSTAAHDGPSLLARAVQAHRDVVDDPARARAAAEQVVAEATAVRSWEAAAVAERALGLAHRELLDVDAAQQHLRSSIALAERAGSAERAGEARLSLAVDLLDGGRPAAALRELGRASAALGEEHAQVHNQLALVYARLARFDEAVGSVSTAVRVAEAAGDLSLVARGLGNRGIMQGERGRLDDGEADLRRALALHEQLGEQLFALDTQHNLGWLLTRRGRLPEALALLDRAEAGIARLGVPLAALRLDRSVALLAAGLAGEAADVARSAALELGEAGRAGEKAEALLAQARGELLAGRWSAAALTAAGARESFLGQDRLAWAALCSAVELRAAAHVDPRAAELVEVRDAAAALDRYGLVDAAADLRLLEGQTLLARGDRERAVEALLPLARSRLRTSTARVRRGHAASLLAAAVGDRAGALRAARGCLDVLEEQRETLGALELHGASAAHGREVARHGLSLAQRPGELLAWADLVRSTALQHPPAQPPDDPELAVALEQLRALAHQRQQAALDDEASSTLAQRRLVLEEQVRRRSRQATGTTGSASGGPPSLREVRALLGGRRLVSLFERDGLLHAQVVDRHRTALVECATTDEVTRGLRHLRLSLRLTVGGRTRSTALARDAAALDRLLSPALGGDGPVLVIPTAGLAALPWAALPSLAGRDLEVAPTLALWCRQEVPHQGTGDLVVAGPGLPHAEQEAVEVAALRPGATVLTGAAATARQVLAALDGARTAHLACHGTWRAENPLFSALLLRDGPLTVHDLARVRRMPEHVVLSACDSGRAGEEPGQELLGLAAAFFAGGTRTLVAGVLPVDDAAARTLMTDLHRSLVDGHPPATALRRAQERAVGEVGTATAQAFVCLTASAQTLSG